MSKKITAILFSLVLGFTGLIASATATASAPQPDPALTDTRVGDQYEAEPQYAPSEEVNFVEESELARKMQQAKKAENARMYDSYGGGITIIAMCIVIGALIVLSILFYIFGNISSWFLKRKKKQTSKSIKSAVKTADDATETLPDTGDVIAAISAALAQHFATDHDMQDTILTIRKLRKAYSPWNSKIYNMRHLPEVVHNHPHTPNTPKTPIQ